MELNGLNKLTTWDGSEGYVSSAPKESAGNYMAAGSQNAMLTGTGKITAHKGVTQRGGGVKGGFVMQNVAETFASLGQTSDTSGYGNVANVFAAIFYIGKGLLRLAGTTLAVTASATLSLLVKRSGSYLASGSGPFQAGLAAPSAAIIRAIDPPAGFTGKVTGTVSIVIWRIRSTTSAESNASPVSNIIAPDNQAIAIAFPLADANGQDAWGIGVTKQIEGRTGSHFKYSEVLETAITQTLSRTDVVTDSTLFTITSAAAGFTSSHIGWTVVLSGGAPACALTTYVVDVPAANTLKLAAKPPTTSTGVHMAMTQAVEGTVRSTVIEYQDGDLVGAEYAPKRNFPPPAGLFGGAREDIFYVDGCYADAVSSTSGSNPGSALAPSEPGQPEAYSPDTVIFTNDLPTAILRGDGVDWRVGRNTVYTINYLGGLKPLSVEIVWEHVGVQYQNQVCLGEGGRLYLWPEALGPLRMGQDGLPEGEFATAVKDDLAACTDASKRVLGWDGISHVVAFCYNKTVWPYFTSLQRWGAPATLSAMGNIRSAITDNNQLLLTDVNDDIWSWNVGTGSLMKVRTPWVSSAGAMDTVAAVVASVRADNSTQPVTVDVFADGDESTSLSTMSVTPPRTGFQRLPTLWPNVIDCDLHQIQISTTSTAGGDHGIERIETFGPSHDTTK